MYIHRVFVLKNNLRLIFTKIEILISNWKFRCLKIFDSEKFRFLKNFDFRKFSTSGNLDFWNLSTPENSISLQFRLLKIKDFCKISILEFLSNEKASF